jgi:hypothetical protein
MTEEQPLDLKITGMNHAELFVAASGVQTVAEALRAMGKYHEAARFLEDFSGALFDLSVQKAKAAGIEPQRTPAEAQVALDRAKKRLVN